MEQYTNILLIVAAIFIVALLGFILIRKKDSSLDALIIQNQVFDLQKQLRESLSESSNRLDERLNSIVKAMNDSQKSINERFDGTLTDVHRRLGQLDESTKNVMEVGKDISKLNQLLRAPKFRGGMGEAFLEEILSQVIPAKHFRVGYPFKSGDKVDAIVNVGEMMVPIDSKFPLENFKRIIESEIEEKRALARKSFAKDVKKHIDDIAGKYILPDEGTSDFALMYIPAENVYYEVVSSFGETCDYARERRVIPVSPNTFYLYLQSILVGLRGFEIERSAREIMVNLSRLKGDILRFKDDFEILGRHISNAKGKYDEAEKKLGGLENKVELAASTNIKEEDASDERKQLFEVQD